MFDTFRVIPLKFAQNAQTHTHTKKAEETRDELT